MVLSQVFPTSSRRLHGNLADLVLDVHGLACLDDEAACRHEHLVLQGLQGGVAGLEVDLGEGVALRSRRGIRSARQDLANLGVDLDDAGVGHAEETVLGALLLQDSVNVEAQAGTVDLGADVVGTVDELSIDLDGVARLRNERTALALIDAHDTDKVEAALAGADAVGGVDGDLNTSVSDGASTRYEGYNKLTLAVKAGMSLGYDMVKVGCVGCVVNCG